MKGPITSSYLLHRGKADKLDKVGSLDLTNHGLTTIDVGLFNELVSLQSLDISGNQLTDFPEDLRLKRLRVLDCCDNKLQSVSFVQKMKGLEQLFMEGNEKLVDEDRYIAKLLCPSLKHIDDEDQVAHINPGLELYRRQLTPQIQAVWEAKFSEVYSRGIEDAELDNLHQEFVDTVNKAQVVGTHLTMPRLKNFMIERLCRELLVSVNRGTYSVGRRNKSDKYSTRVSLGATPVKDYRTMNSGDSQSPEKKTSKPSTPKPVAGKRKREATPTSSPAAKRQRNEHGNAVPCEAIKPTEGNLVQLPRVDDFEPSRVLRCHSKQNNPADETTKVWKCAFEPRLKNSGDATILATCGGNIVCFVDCQTGKVMRRYKDNSDDESFYALAWTTLKADGDNLKDDINILAVAGEDCTIKLINPRQLVMFGSLTGHKGYVSTLVFHPHKPNILFSGSRDNKVIMWEIGVPDIEDNTIEWRKKAVLCLPRTDAITLTIDPGLNVLVAGCEQSCYGWALKGLGDKKRPTADVSPSFEFVHLRAKGEDASDVVVDGLVMLSNHCIVSKCVGQSCLYVWDLKASVVEGSRSRSRLARVTVRPLAQLLYTPVEVDYLHPHASSDVLCVGDDEGQVHLYDLRSLVKNKSKKNCVLRASRVLECPELVVDQAYQGRMEDLTTTVDIVVNCIALSPNHDYLAYGTDNNLVSIWKNAKKL